MAVYPLVATIRNSFYDSTSTTYVGITTYRAVFSTASILVTFRNNVIGVLVFAFWVMFVGLGYEVLAERIRWSTAFKTVVFMPIVFSATASGLVWRTIFDLDPHVGIVNATIQTASSWVDPPGLYPIDTSAGQSVAALASTAAVAGPSDSLQTASTVQAGDVAELGLTGMRPAALQLAGAEKAVVPDPFLGSVSGLVWRDFSPSNPSAKGQVLADEDGIPGLRLSLIRSDGSIAGSTTTDKHGGFRFDRVGGGRFRVQIDARNFGSGFYGIFWFGARSLTPTNSPNQPPHAVLHLPLVDLSMIVAYLWIWAGFAMVVIGAGLAALDREVLEAARIDGARYGHLFRRLPLPILSPVLVVVLMTMLISVLKIFDIILN